MPKLIGLMIVLFLAGSNNGIAQVTSSYPNDIILANTQRQYDVARWFLYCIHCDEKVIFYKKNNIISNTLTFGQLDLRFDKMLIRGDTVEINFLFYYQGEKIDYNDVKLFPYWGVVFIGKSDKIVTYSSKGHIRYHSKECYGIKKCPEREVRPLQPEVVKYIRNNKVKLDPWFRKEAIKRGVIKE